ncbi:hypothetical protein SAMD00019534_091320, partial [Acytostelium subglobosum LB1]|uniref:hypothetical protein n=1 Tax=Acytostelium subglobosum LB1 TaxID=1410327 RepID=UPI000645026E
MSEVHVLVGRAQVFTHSAQTNNWVPSSPSPATLLLYHHQGNNSYRVIARGFEDPNQILINFSITKDVIYKFASANFHTMSDQRTHYGINFATKDEADQFGAGIDNVINQLKNSGSSSPSYPPPPVQQQQPPQPQYQAPQQPQYQAPQQPQAPLSQSQPMQRPQMQLPPQIAKPGAAPQPTQQPPQMQIPARPPSVNLGKSAAAPAPPVPPPAPKPPAGGPPPPPGPPPPANAPPRGALLSSIEGFSKNGLKKTVTVDKSGPLIGGNTNASTPASGSSLNVGGGGGGAGTAAAPKAMGGGGGGGGNMMAEMMAKRNAMKKTPVVRDEVSSAPTPAPAAVPAPAPTPSPVPIQKATPAPSPAVSKPKPPPASNRPNLSPNNTAPAPSALTDPDMLALKEEILSEFRREMAKFKEEILEAIRSSSH